MKLLRLFLVILFMDSVCFAQSIPAVKAKALDNSEITLPNPGSHQALILIVGFSHKSGDLCKVWGKKVAADYGGDARITYYVLPVIQSAPSLVRPMILHGMRKDTPSDQLPHFVPIYSNEADWKKLVNVAGPDDAYLIIAAPDGHAVWQAHGAYSDDIYADLKKALSGMLEKAGSSPNKNE